MDPYEVLGVARNATQEQIKVAYRRKARECHPDINQAADASETFEQIQLAYDRLSVMVPARSAQQRSSTPDLVASGLFDSSMLKYGASYLTTETSVFEQKSQADLEAYILADAQARLGRIRVIEMACKARTYAAQKAVTQRSGWLV